MNANDLLQRAEAFRELPEDFMSEFELSDKEIDEIMDARFIIPSLVISGQITIIAAKAGAGKTSILMHECANAVDAGYRVKYVNMDTSAGDLKYWDALAKASGFTMVIPHFKGSRGIDDWMSGLSQMAADHDDLNELFIVIDTLKKIANLMDKSRVKYLMILLRTLTAKGATIVCAAHTNKHRDRDNKLVFEGVGDIESDCDNLIYLESRKESDGSKTVTSEPSDKVRGVFESRSWMIRPDRTVEALDRSVDVRAETEADTQREKDATIIEAIQVAIRGGHQSRIKIFDFVADHGITRRPFDAVLARYCKGSTPPNITPLWERHKDYLCNADVYALLGDAHGIL